MLVCDSTTTYSKSFYKNWCWKSRLIIRVTLYLDGIWCLCGCDANPHKAQGGGVNRGPMAIFGPGALWKVNSAMCFPLHNVKWDSDFCLVLWTKGSEWLIRLSLQLITFRVWFWMLQWSVVLIWTGPASCHQRPSDSLPPEPRADETDEGELDQTLSSPIITAHNLDAATENCIGSPTPASQGDIPNGTDTLRWSPESTNLDCSVDEGRPLIGPLPESVELTMWSSEGRGETCEAAEEAADRGRCCQCKCCQSGRVPAFFSVLASLLCTAGILYALYFYVPIKPPDCPDVASRVVFTLCCCVVAAIPILFGTLQTPAHWHSKTAMWAPQMKDKD